MLQFYTSQYLKKSGPRGGRFTLFMLTYALTLES